MNSESMGLPYVPFTFPTITVQTFAEQAQVPLTVSEVDRIWVSYKKATVENKMAPYNSERAGKNAPIIQFLVSDTGYTPIKIVAWLNALQKASVTWGPVWLDPGAYLDNPIVNPGTAFADLLKTTGKDLGAFLAPATEPVTNLIKYTAIALVAGAVVYGIYQSRSYFKGRKRRKG